MATTAAASATKSFTVPEWIERNSQVLRAVPAGVDDRSIKKCVGIKAGQGSRDATKVEQQEYAAACMAAMLINEEEGTGWIEAPTGLQSASYFKDVANHANFLATIMYTARTASGFLPSAMGQQLSQEQLQEFIDKFNAYLRNLDAFWFYVTLVDQSAEHIEDKNATTTAIANNLSQFFLSNANGKDKPEDVASRVLTTLEYATKYMVEKNLIDSDTSTTQDVVNAAFEHEALGTPDNQNPTLPLCFLITTLSKPSDKDSTIKYSSTILNKLIFQLNSANVIANAEALAQGSILIGTKTYCDFVSAPLNEWIKNTTSP